MAIILEKETKERKGMQFSLPTWVVMVFIILLTFGLIAHFLFFTPTEKVEIKEEKEGLTKQEIVQVNNLLTSIDKEPFTRLRMTIPKSIISDPPVDTTKLGRSNPFVP